MPPHRGCAALRAAGVCAAILAGRACVEGVALSARRSHQAISSAAAAPPAGPPHEPSRLHFAVIPPASKSQMLAHASTKMVGPFVVHTFGGNFDGLKGLTNFISAITTGLDNATLKRIQDCGVGARGQLGASRGDDTNAVWIVMNPEDETGEFSWNFVRTRWLDPQDRVLVLGSRWNATRKEDIVREAGDAVMYIPQASFNFAERHRHTPMDLYTRSNISFDRERRGVLAYQQKRCKADDLREAMFTALDTELRAAGEMPGSALSSCHGLAPNTTGGYMNAAGVNCDKNCRRDDESVGRYEDFRFVLTMEHGAAVAHHGYITEKIVNAFLAGAVPISHSSAEIAAVFNSDAYVAVDAATPEGRSAGAKAMLDLLHDPAEWDRKRRLPSVSEEVLRKYFSWHPAVWESHGDFLRQQIVGEVLRMCG